MKGLPRRAARRDTAEGPIIDALLACGFSVQRISAKDVPDLLVGKHGISRAIEVKTGTEPLRPGQVEWWARWRGNGCIVLRSVDDVPKLAKYWASLSLRAEFL